MYTYHMQANVAYIDVAITHRYDIKLALPNHLRGSFTLSVTSKTSVVGLVEAQV